MHSAVNTVTFNSVIKPAKGRHVQDHLAHEVGTDLSAGESENTVTSNHSISARELWELNQPLWAPSVAGGCLLSACGTDGGCVSLLAVEQISSVLESGREREPFALGAAAPRHASTFEGALSACEIGRPSASVPGQFNSLMWSAGRSVHVRLEVVVKFSFLKLIETCVLSA